MQAMMLTMDILYWRVIEIGGNYGAAISAGIRFYIVCIRTKAFGQTVMWVVTNYKTHQIKTENKLELANNLTFN